jgi:class 3 adenylate cyclase
MNGTRRLAAILFADIIGYTKLMNESESKGLDTLDKYKKIISDLVPAFGGEVIKNYGDGCLMLFDIPSDAIKCAIKMQQEFKKAREVPVRIGAHLGEVIHNKDDYYGDGINIASRLESIAEANSILMSRAIRDQVKNKDSVNTELIGSFDLKNVGEPVEVFAVSNKGLFIPTLSSVSKKESVVHESESASLTKKKKDFSSLMGVALAASIVMIGFQILGIIPFQVVGIVITSCLALLVLNYFSSFGFRFDVYGNKPYDDYSASEPRYIEDQIDDSLELKEIEEPLPRKFNDKDFI